jgi:DNA-binding NarL/FixJ family response regulator
VVALLQGITVPTLVLHARQDGVVPLEEGRLLAAGIAGSRFVELESRNHVLLEHEPAWERFCTEVLQFLGEGFGDSDARLSVLTARERAIVAGLVAGRTNAQIAASLFISDKTVRNALTRIFEKLGVHSRTQAMALLRDADLPR